MRPAKRCCTRMRQLSPRARSRGRSAPRRLLTSAAMNSSRPDRRGPRIPPCRRAPPSTGGCPRRARPEGAAGRRSAASRAVVYIARRVQQLQHLRALLQLVAGDDGIVHPDRRREEVLRGRLPGGMGRQRRASANAPAGSRMRVRSCMCVDTPWRCRRCEKPGARRSGRNPWMARDWWRTRSGARPKSPPPRIHCGIAGPRPARSSRGLRKVVAPEAVEADQCGVKVGAVEGPFGLRPSSRSSSGRRAAEGRRRPRSKRSRLPGRAGLGLGPGAIVVEQPAAVRSSPFPGCSKCDAISQSDAERPSPEDRVKAGSASAPDAAKRQRCLPAQSARVMHPAQAKGRPRCRARAGRRPESATATAGWPRRIRPACFRRWRWSAARRRTSQTAAAAPAACARRAPPLERPAQLERAAGVARETRRARSRPARSVMVEPQMRRGPGPQAARQRPAVSPADLGVHDARRRGHRRCRSASVPSVSRSE